jgi:hypothetical protein
VLLIWVNSGRPAALHFIAGCGRANKHGALARLPSTIGRGGDQMEEQLPRALPRDVPDYHERQAAHFRALASTATTRGVKARLVREAEEHEQIARGEPVLAFTDN